MKALVLIHYYKVFKEHAGKKLPTLILIVVFTGLLEGLGISMFIPLLSEGNVTSADQYAVSGILYGILSFFGISPDFTPVLLFILGVFLLRGVLQLGSQALSAHITATLTRNLRENLVSLLMRTNYPNFLRMDTGFLANLVTKESDRAVASFNHYANTLASLVHVGVYGAVCMMISWRVAFILGVLGLVTIVMLGFVHRLSHDYSVRTTKHNASLEELLIQTIQFFKYLKATNSFPQLKKKLDAEIRTLADFVFRLGVISGGLKSVTEPLGVVVVVALLYVNVSMLGQPVSGTLLIVFLLYRTMNKFMSAQNLWQKFNSAVGGLEEITRTFNRMGGEIEEEGPHKVANFQEAIELKNLDFFYERRQVLFDINMSFPKNKTVALVGRTGSGKSTIANLIMGVEPPASGKILFDGISYHGLNKASLRKLLGYVTQESVLFNDSIANNISFWSCSDADPECLWKVTAAARAVHCDEFIEKTDHGYLTLLGDWGSTISGGQRQQICIARELFKEPEILILDEAMSALDAHSESLIQKSLAELQGSRTIIIITHRLATVKACDYVYVLDEGRIVEEGTYQYLSQKGDSRFFELARLQSL